MSILRWLILAGVLAATIVAAAPTAIPFLLFAALKLSTPSDEITMRYRMTVSLTRTGEMYTGSGVVESRHRTGANFGGGDALSIDVRGEAVGIDVPGAGRFFALLRERPNYPSSSIIADACGRIPQPKEYRRGLILHWFRQIDTAFRTTCKIPFDALPFFVRFRDPGNPDSIEVYRADNLPFNLQVAAATVTRTNEAPTYGQTDILLSWLDPPGPFLPQKPRVQVKRNFIGRAGVTVIDAGSFRYGLVPDSK